MLLEHLYSQLQRCTHIILLTSAEIIKVDKKPFGTEERRATSLELITAIEHERDSWRSKIFNFGTVTIRVGEEKIIFEDVFNPSQIQNEIEKRIKSLPRITKPVVRKASPKDKSVLIVDDQNNWRQLLAEILQGEFEVHIAGTYDEALTAITTREKPFHVVITDLRLVDDDPENEDGLRLIEEVNKLRNFTKSIVITGYPTIKTAKRALGELQVFIYIEKHPAEGAFDSSNFINMVRNAAEEAEKARKHNQLDVLIAMPFDEKSRNLYERVIKVTLENLGFSCKRGDETFPPALLWKVF